MEKLLKVIAEQNEEAECCFQLKRVADALDKNEMALGAVSQFGRIADAMEEILRLVKKDMEKYEEKNKK